MCEGPWSGQHVCNTHTHTDLCYKTGALKDCQLTFSTHCGCVYVAALGRETSSERPVTYPRQFFCCCQTSKWRVAKPRTAGRRETVPPESASLSFFFFFNLSRRLLSLSSVCLSLLPVFARSTTGGFPNRSGAPVTSRRWSVGARPLEARRPLVSQVTGL